MILIGYDGSADAQAAIEQAARLMPGAEATVVTVWEPITMRLSRTPAGLGPFTDLGDISDVDRETEHAALKRAREGARLANQRGLHATAATASRRFGTAEAILERADQLDVDAIVLGSRGLTGFKSLLLGSVSHGVVQQADRPVVIVPSTAIAAARRDRHRHHAAV